jgi:hypothetical protein
MGSWAWASKNKGECKEGVSPDYVGGNAAGEWLRSSTVTFRAIWQVWTRPGLVLLFVTVRTHTGHKLQGLGYMEMSCLGLADLLWY